MNKKPLVTISMAAYNQDKYIRDSVRGMLSQTYEPLEIVISDDHSTDRTWDIINEEINDYKAGDGIHKNIVLNRNEKNLGIAWHSNVISRLEHGVLRIMNAGDDISYPNRVERIVEEWIKDGRRAYFIHNGGRLIDEDGNDLGPIPHYDIAYSLGAASTYRAFPVGLFEPIKFQGAYEDCVFATRAMMLGPGLEVPDELMAYRKGVGLSSIKGVPHRLRVANVKGARSNLLACRQNLLDLERIHGKIPEERWMSVKAFVEDRIKREEAHCALYDGKTFFCRFRGFWDLGFYRFCIRSFIVNVVFLLPMPVANCILDFIDYSKSISLSLHMGWGHRSRMICSLSSLVSASDCDDNRPSDRDD